MSWWNITHSAGRWIRELLQLGNSIKQSSEFTEMPRGDKIMFALHVFSLLFSSTQQILTEECPPTFHLVGDLTCLKVYATALTFCEANEKCLQASKVFNLPLFLITTAYVNASHLISRNFAWTGISRLSTVSNFKNSVWFYSNGYSRPLIANRSELRWTRNETDLGERSLFARMERFGLHSSHLIPAEEVSNEEGGVICQLSEAPTPTFVEGYEIMAVKFYSNLADMDPIYETDNYILRGCFRRYLGRTKLQCLFTWVLNTVFWYWVCVYSFPGKYNRYDYQYDVSKSFNIIQTEHSYIELWPKMAPYVWFCIRFS